MAIDTRFNENALSPLKHRFDSVRDYLWRLSRCGEIPGAVLHVRRRGEILFHEAIGWRDRERSTLMPIAGVFRTKSMTKLLTTMTVLQSVERGVWSLLDPIERYLPNFAKLRVLVDPDQDLTQPLRRPVTIYDLLTHTSGLSYGQVGRVTNTLYKDAGLYFDIDFKTPLSTTDLVERLATLPLAFQPGSRWAYSWASDVLGRALEVAHGRPLDDVFKLGFLDQLSIHDVGFFSRAGDRLIPVPDHDRIFYRDLSDEGQPVFLSGGEGLLATAEAWAAVVDFVAGDGHPELLSPRTRRYMVSDHIGSLRHRPDFPLQPGLSYGMGVYVRCAEGLGSSQGAVGEFGWWGSWGSSFWANREEGLTGVLMMQQPDESRAIIEAVKFMIYSGLR